MPFCPVERFYSPHPPLHIKPVPFLVPGISHLNFAFSYWCHLYVPTVYLVWVDLLVWHCRLLHNLFEMSLAYSQPTVQTKQLFCFALTFLHSTSWLLLPGFLCRFVITVCPQISLSYDLLLCAEVFVFRFASAVCCKMVDFPNFFLQFFPKAGHFVLSLCGIFHRTYKISPCASLFCWLFEKMDFHILSLESSVLFMGNLHSSYL